MAIYHCHTKPISRKAGMSAPGRAAYCSGEKVKDWHTGMVHKREKGGVEHQEIILPREAEAQTEPWGWARDPEALWNAAEAAERRKDSRVAREYQLALPHELALKPRIELVRAFSRSLADRYGIAVHFALHEPDRQGDRRNYHAHLLATTRVLTPSGMGEKALIELCDRDRARRHLRPAGEEIRAWRHHWAHLANDCLREHGHEARIDARSYEEQGIDREPTHHRGWVITDLVRQGKASEVMERWQAESAEHRQAREAALAEEEHRLLEIEGERVRTMAELAIAQAEEPEFEPELERRLIEPDPPEPQPQQKETDPVETWLQYRRDRIKERSDPPHDPVGAWLEYRAIQRALKEGRELTAEQRARVQEWDEEAERQRQLSQGKDHGPEYER